MALRKRTQKRLRTIGGWVLAVIVILFIAEWVARGLQNELMDPSESPHLAFDPDVGYIYKPHYTQDIENPAGNRVVIDINSLGLRDREVTGRRRGELRIVGLGDSFTAATQVNQSDTYLRQIDEIAGAAGQSTQTINAGVDGYNLHQSLALLRKHMEDLNPTVVLLGLYVGDDIRDYNRSEGLALPGKSFFKSKSYLYHLVQRGYHRIKGGRAEPAEADPDQIAKWRELLSRFGDSPEDEAIARVARNARAGMPVLLADGIAEADWAGTEDMLHRIRDFVETQGARLVVVILPTKLQVYPLLLVEAGAVLEMDTEDFDLSQPQRRLLDITDRLEIPAVDLLPAFRSHSSPESLYFPWYRYWNETGHRLAAEEIYQFLAEGGYIKN